MMESERLHRGLFLLAIVAAAGLAAAADWNEAGRARLEVSELTAQQVRLHISTGAIHIQGVAGDTVEAAATMDCQRSQGRCADTAKKLAWSVDRADDHVTLRLRPKWGDFGDARVRVDVKVPADRALYFDIDAGEIRVTDMQACVTGHVDAGDVRVGMSADVVRRVHLDTDVGDASLRTPDYRLEGDRSWLVGARVDWDGGPGDCDVDISLNAGDLRLELF